jgi:hypothetical protein
MFQPKIVPGRPAIMRLLAAVTVGATLLALGACGGGEQPAAPAAVTVETGGMSLADGSAGAATASQEMEGVTLAEEEPAATTPAGEISTADAPVLGVGETITAGGTVAVYADADPSSVRFAQYETGAVLTIVEAAGDYSAYPVEVDGRRWYRVRAADGLVGWVAEP